MQKWCCRLATATAWVFMILFVVQHWYVWNTSPSLPTGLYLKTWRVPQPGDIVLVCPPDLPIFRAALARRFLSSGLCPAGTGPLIKSFVATAGDRVIVEATGVSVNGQPLPGSARQAFDLTPVPDWSRTLAEGEVLLMATHPQSFDARYFGPLDRGTIITPLQPLWVVKE